RLLADRARVEDDDVRLVLRAGLAEAELLEHALDALAVVRVHLAPERRDEIAAHRRQGTGGRAQGPAPRSSAGIASRPSRARARAAAAQPARRSGRPSGHASPRRPRTRRMPARSARARTGASRT